MSKNILEMKKDLTSQELSILEIELKKRRKNPVVLWLLWLFTGSLGGHRYYLGDKGRAILHTVVFFIAIVLGLVAASNAKTEVEALVYAPMAMMMFLSIPALWAIIDAFFIGRRLAQKNAEIEAQIIEQIKQMRS